MADPVDYQVFGLRVRSEIELPELTSIEQEGAADVFIRRGSEPSLASVGPGLHPDRDTLLLSIPNVARYRICGGREVVVDAELDAHERNVRLFLLGSAFGALLHQRGLLPLHANAVEIDGIAFAFMGESGVGKSTLAAWFHDGGRRIIADDVCVVGFDHDRRAYAAPGIPRLRLWREALEASGRDASKYERSYVGESYDKFDVPVAAEVAHRTPLGAIYIITSADAFSIDPLQGLEAAETVFAHTYRGAYVRMVGSQRTHWRSCIELIQGVPVYAIRRPESLDLLDAFCTRIATHAASQARPREVLTDGTAST